MSCAYKFNNADKVYFITFATVRWGRVPNYHLGIKFLLKPRKTGLFGWYKIPKKGI